MVSNGFSCILEFLSFPGGGPTHKTSKVTVWPGKTQISLGICPVWSKSSLSAWRKLGSLATHCAQRRLWSDWADAQADLSLPWRHSHFVGFVMSSLNCFREFQRPPIHIWFRRFLFFQMTQHRIWEKPIKPMKTSPVNATIKNQRQ